jgi:hypothetical protein
MFTIFYRNCACFRHNLVRNRLLTACKIEPLSRPGWARRQALGRLSHPLLRTVHSSFSNRFMLIMEHKAGALGHWIRTRVVRCSTMPGELTKEHRPMGPLVCQTKMCGAHEMSSFAGGSETTLACRYNLLLRPTRSEPRYRLGFTSRT